jgi:hypothetical protein
VHAETSVLLAIEKPKLCPEGRISRARFEQKRRALQKKLDAGLITAEDYARY